MPAKRKAASAKQAEKDKAPAKQAKQDGQKAISHDIDVPLDEGFHNGKWVLFLSVPVVLKFAYRECKGLH